MNSVPENDRGDRLLVVQPIEQAEWMARWIRLCRSLVIPINVIAVTIVVVGLSHEAAVLCFSVWMYLYPVTAALLAIVTASFFASWAAVPSLLGIVVRAAAMSALNVPIYWSMTFWDNLGPM